MAPAVLEVNNVSKKYCRNLRLALKYGYADSLRRVANRNVENMTLRKHEFWALKEISFKLQKGDRLGVLGRNGAGKSTLMKLIAGISTPDSGAIITTGTVDQMIELTSGFHPMMTGYQNARLRARIMGLTENQFKGLISHIIEFTELHEAIHTPVKYYSSGMKARLGFAISTIRKPDILIIDEALAVGDLDFRLKCYEFIAEYLKDTVLIFVSHSLAHIKRFCNIGMYLEKGKIKHYGDTQTAIELYQNTSGGASAANVNGLNPDAVEFSIRTLDDKANGASDTLVVDFGDTLIVDVVPKKLPQDCVVSINIADSAGRALMEIQNSQSFNTRFDLPFSCTIGPLYLNSGYYRVNLVVHESDGFTLCSYTPWLNFQCRGHLSGHAPLQPPGVWKQIEQ